MRIVLTFAALLLLAGTICADSTESGQLPRTSEREVLYEDGITADEYARVLDYFEIEIGAEGKDGKIQYAKNFTKRKPDKRVASKDLERRLRTGWKRGTLHAIDRKLLARAGIYTQDKALFHYYSSDLEQQLLKLETEYAGLKPEEIKRTRFQACAVSTGDERGYEFFVVEQDPRPAKPKSPRDSNNDEK